MSAEKSGVFLSHNSRDKDAVKTVMDRLQDEFDIESWLDVYGVTPGEPWSPEIEAALKNSSACIVFLGEHGWGSYHLDEAKLALKSGLRVIPVLLPGAKLEDAGVLGDIFEKLQRVDLRNGFQDDAAFQGLVSGIRGVPPEAPVGFTPFRIRRDAKRWNATRKVDKNKLYRGQDLIEAQRTSQLFANLIGELEREFLTSSAIEEQALFSRERTRVYTRPSGGRRNPLQPC